MGLSWNLIGGYLGLVSFGQAAFFGLGAFTVVILAHDFGITPWIGLPLAGLAGCVSALIVGAVTFRFRGFYFALAMLAYPLALLYVFEWGGWSEVAIPMRREAPWTFMQFEDPRILAWMALALFAIAMALSLAIERSRFGLVLFAIRQDEVAARTAGIPAFRNKLKTIAISGVFAGCAGALYALALLVVTPASVFGMLVSAQALIIPMFGGRGTAWGAAIGAALLVPLSETLHAHFGASFPGIAGVVFGLAIILVVLLLPNGIYWAFADWARKRFPSAPPTRAATGRAAPPAVPSAAPRILPGSELLAVSNISVAFGGVKALQSVTFDIRHREILGIIGPNGAGKTTLFNVLSGLVPPMSGQAVFRGGRELVGLTPDAICALGIGRTFQTVRAFRRLTLLENVVAGAFVRFKDDEEALEQAWQVLERVGLEDRALRLGAELNNRELRLMELARALAGRPQLVLLDECLAGLSAEDIEHMMGVLRKVREDDVTIAIIEHTMHAMAKLADRLVVLDHGAVIVSGLPGEVLKHPEVISAYLGKRWLQHAHG
jgi:branched-chain amino acid transport system permease protein